jgi:hypothetical protein
METLETDFYVANNKPLRETRNGSKSGNTGVQFGKHPTAVLAPAILNESDTGEAALAASASG